VIVKRSFDRFVAYVLEDLQTAGQGNSTQVYYEMRNGVMMSSDIRKRDRPHPPLYEFILLGELLLFSFLFFVASLSLL